MYLLPDGKKIAAGRAFTIGETQYPANFMRLASADEKAALGITEIVKQARPDDRLAFINDDPANPGDFIVTAFSPEMVKERLTVYAAQRRYEKETGGVLLGASVIATDRGSQAMVAGAFAYTQRQPAKVIKWRGVGGAFVALTAAEITAIADAVGDHVQACFALEDSIVVQIASGAIATHEAVDAAFAASP